MALALKRLGMKQGDRVGTMAWNTHRHFEMFYAAPGMGYVLHTVNPRLFPEQLVYIINHAEDRTAVRRPRHAADRRGDRAAAEDGRSLRR